MADGVLANSKNALIFAGGVIACAVLLATTIGSQFTPKDQGEAVEEQDVPRTRTATASPSRRRPRSTSASAPSETEFFGDFEGFADDKALIDDTAGFDPSPSDDSSVILEESPSFEEPDPQSSRSTNQPSRLEQEREAPTKRPKGGDVPDDVNWVSKSGQR
ncbi:MAG: hypothetical protein AAGA34_15440 [Pseudomonadota bacterium]